MNKVNEKIDFRAEVEKIARDNNISVEYVSNDYNAFNIVRVFFVI